MTMSAQLADGSWPLSRLSRDNSDTLLFGASAEAVYAGAEDISPRQMIALPVDGATAERYDATPGVVCLLRPDQQVCARWPSNLH